MEIPENVQAVLKTLEAAGHEAWCVGGCVRDALLGRSPGDWDVTTSAQPEETLGVFGPQGLPTGLRHGTVTVKMGDGPVEVTTYRLDGAYRDHRRARKVRRRTPPSIPARGPAWPPPELFAEAPGGQSGWRPRR